MAIEVINCVELAKEKKERTKVFNTRKMHAWVHYYPNPGDHDEMHCHNADQTFICFEGQCTMHFPDGDRAVLNPGMAALINDLHDRGQLESTLVVMLGEFGRTPKINDRAGRDHWPYAMSVLMAGAGIPTGQIIGATDKHGNEPSERPVKFQEVFATLYSSLGINTASATVKDPQGRPHYLVDSGIKPIHELVG